MVSENVIGTRVAMGTALLANLRFNVENQMMCSFENVTSEGHCLINDNSGRGFESHVFIFSLSLSLTRGSLSFTRSHVV